MSRESEIQKDTEYCLNCVAKPCSEKGCPLSNNIHSNYNVRKFVW